MGTNLIIRSSGNEPNPTQPLYPGPRTSVTLSDGRHVVLVCDSTGADDVLRLYEISADKSTRTLRTTLSGLPNLGNLDEIILGQFANNDLAVAWRANGRHALRYQKVSGSTWAPIGPTEAPYINSHPWEILSWDMDVSDTGMVLISVNIYNGSNRIYGRLIARNLGGTWGPDTGVFQQTLMSGGTLARGCDSSTVAALGVSSGVRSVVIAHSSGVGGNDSGIQLKTLKVTESSGALNGAVEFREIYCDGQTDRSTRGNLSTRRTRLFRTGTNEYLVAVMHRVNTRRFGLARGTWDGTTWNSLTTFRSSRIAEDRVGPLAISCDAESKTVNYYHDGAFGLGQETIRIQTAKWNDTGGVTFYDWGNYLGFRTDRVWGTGTSGVWCHLGVKTDHLVTAHLGTNVSGNDVEWRALWGGMPEAIPPYDHNVTGMAPSDGVLTSQSSPVLSAYIIVPGWRATYYKVEFQFAQDEAFATNTFNFYSDQWTDAGGGAEPALIQARVPEPGLVGGAWYWRTRVVDLWDNVSDWSPHRALLVGHPPVMQPTTPGGGTLFAWNGGQVQFHWKFTDPASTDYQTAFQVQIYTEQGTLIHDSLKISSDNKFYTYTLPLAYKDETLYWIVRGYDKDDSQGEFSDPTFFGLTDPPSIVAVVPTENQTIDTGIPFLSGVVTTGGIRFITQFTVKVFKAGLVIWSGTISGQWASGSTVGIQIPQGYLEDTESYTVQFHAVDDASLTGQSPSINFTVDWIPPAAPSGLVVDTAPYNISDLGYVHVTWEDTNRDPDFVNWNVYRKDDFIQQGTLDILEEGTFRLIYKEYDSGEGYEFKDYFAPSGYRSQYLITQMIDRDGQDIESDKTTIVNSFPRSDGYWLLEPSDDSRSITALKLGIVTGDSYTPEQEEAEVLVIGRGRVYQKGTFSGPKGTLELQLRNDGGTSARQKKLRLETLQRTTRRLWMRNPFGDTIPVNVSAMTIGRIAGVGVDEFCDVSIPYGEVAQA